VNDIYNANMSPINNNVLTVKIGESTSSNNNNISIFRKITLIITYSYSKRKLYGYLSDSNTPIIDIDTSEKLYTMDEPLVMNKTKNLNVDLHNLLIYQLCV
jgi:hypothetical protein